MNRQPSNREYATDFSDEIKSLSKEDKRKSKKK